jgi:hypothetical protein
LKIEEGNVEVLKRSLYVDNKECVISLGSDMTIEIVDEVNVHRNRYINLDEFISKDDAKWIFEAVASDPWIERARRSNIYKLEVSCFDVDFAKHLETFRVPKYLAFYLGCLSQGRPHVEDLWASFRKTGKPFYYNPNDGKSSFEIYLEFEKEYGQKVADSIISIKSSSREELWDAARRLQNKIHPDGVQYVVNFSRESIEVLMMICDFMNLRSRTTALAVCRTLSESEGLNWPKASKILKSLSSNEKDFLSIEKVLKDYGVTSEDELYAASQLQNSLTTSGYHVSNAYGRNVPTASWRVILAILIEKYDAKSILDALGLLTLDKTIEDKDLSTMIITTEYVFETGDLNTPLDWIILAYGESVSEDSDSEKDYDDNF